MLLQSHQFSDSMTKTTHTKMDVGVLDRQPTAAPDHTVGPATIANERRQAWARSRDSFGQGSKPDLSDAQQIQSNGTAQTQEPGQVPSKIANWVIDCRTPLAASLDEQSSSPSKATNHLQSKNNKPEACFDFVAGHKRIQYKERGRSMNSTGSGKSSTVSSVSELLDLYEEDPEEILLNLGFGREEPDLSSKIPPRFFNSTSSARGIDIKVYLGAQLQRLELENPNYALTSRFRQIEVLTTVANEFFQLYSHVSGQPVNRFTCKDLGGEGEKGEQQGSANKDPSTLKRTNSARNMAKLIKKMSKQNLLGSTAESPQGVSPNKRAQLNGHTASPDPACVNDQTSSGTDHDRANASSDHQVEMVSQKHVHRKDNFPLATVTEEPNGGGEGDRPMESSPEQSSTGPEHQPDSADLHTTHQKTEEEGDRVAKDETDLTSTPEKVLPKLTPFLLAQLHTENANSFDMEEIQTNDDEALPSRTSRITDLSRTVSQQSDSSGFAEEPSGDSSSYLKVQESCDSCDSETTVTSHPSQDVATPQPLDQPAFELLGGREEEPESSTTLKAEHSGTSMEEAEHEESLEQVPQYAVHQLPMNRLSEEGEQLDMKDRTDPDTEPQPDQTQSTPAYEQEPQPVMENTENLLTEEPLRHTEPLTLIDAAEEKTDSVLTTPMSPVVRALNRAKQNQLRLLGQHKSIQIDNPSQTPGGTISRRGLIPMQRSSSLPLSLLSPSKVVSSVRIQFGQGQALCTPPRYSIKYIQEDGEQKEYEEKQEEEQSNCVSTLIINPGSKEIPPHAIPPKPIPHHLMRSAYSLQSSSPPPPGSPDQRHSWTTQSVPDLSSSNHELNSFQLNTNQNQQTTGSGRMIFPRHNTPMLGSEPNLFPRHTTYPYPPYHYASPPFNHHSPPVHHYSSLTSLHQPATPPVPPHSSLINLHQPYSSSAPYVDLGCLLPGTPPMNEYSFSHPLPFPAAPPAHQFGSPYYGTHGYTHLPPGFPPSAAPGSGRCPSSTEMQLRKVLHEIRGTVQSFGQSRISSPDLFGELRAAATSQQSVAEFQQKRRSLNMFRNQMMDLELSIMRQQAVVYKHLSPADRMEAEQLQSLRSQVREELQELEQQLEDRLMELTPHSNLRGLHREGSVDSLSTASALRAMEPVSDLLREQFFLQSELCYGGHGPSSVPSTRSPSPVRREGDDGKQSRGVYRASINITPSTPARPNTHTKEAEEEQRDPEEVEREKGEEHETPEREREAEKFRPDNFQQLIREIRESVAQEVRREIYNELLAAASPQGSTFSARQQPM
ncbi:protein ITPRID2 isoform X2 [Poeciliopsis prolifica]|uniref:protein ITPRID2 isoform X2 n=1 Tax=Poeciliopsis prolifica TaxID=188132 RepID=UPI0024131E5B|nr:protein ITPRID2 isoform X2 [Poeciliopsis prolifica]